MANTGFLIWITGLAGSGKTTLGREVVARLRDQATPCIFLDGDDLREITGGIFGYSQAERLRCAEFYSRLCQKLCSEGCNVVFCTISMFDAVRDLNRGKIPKYLEVFLDASPEVLRARDQKGLYSKAENADQVAGVGMSIETPKSPDILFKVLGPLDVRAMAAQVLKAVDERGWRKTDG